MTIKQRMIKIKPIIKIKIYNDIYCSELCEYLKASFGKYIDCELFKCALRERKNRDFVWRCKKCRASQDAVRKGFL